MAAFAQFAKIHQTHASDQLRMGQRFCIMYFKDYRQVPGLFNEPDEGKAEAMIREWLRNNQYEIDLPRQIRQESDNVV